MGFQKYPLIIVSSQGLFVKILWKQLEKGFFMKILLNTIQLKEFYTGFHETPLMPSQRILQNPPENKLKITTNKVFLQSFHTEAS